MGPLPTGSEDGASEEVEETLGFLVGSLQESARSIEVQTQIWISPSAQRSLPLTIFTDNGNIHNHRRCPLIVLGGASGGLEGNLHLKAPDRTPMANVMLSLMHTLGHDDMDSFGDSTGAFPLTMPMTDE